MPTDTTVNNLVINKLTKAQYDAIQNPSDTEIYLVPDVIDIAPTSGSNNLVTSGGVYNALSSKADASDIPTNVSDLNNDAGYIKGYTETDPTVPSWAKASTKPSYTASEVGALPDTTSIPTESTVSGWGFTKNTGTVTSVSMNGSTYNPTSGVVDLGTVITSHQSLADYVQKSNTSGLLKNDGTVDTNTYLTTETEPAYTQSAAATLTSNNIVKGASQNYIIWSGT